jgi:hypothetical protein
MSYQYLYCAACGVRRTGHGYQCSVCGGLLRRESPRPARTPHPVTLRTTFVAPRPAETVTHQPERQPVAA